MKPAVEPVQKDPGSSIRCFWRREVAFPFEWHSHPEYELTWITRSRGRRFIGDHIGSYDDGELALVGSDLPHTWQSANSSRNDRHEALVVQFGRDFLGESFETQPEARDLFRLLDRSRRGLLFSGRSAEEATSCLSDLPERGPLDRVIDLLRVLGVLCKAKSEERSLAGIRYRPRLASVGSSRMDAVTSYVLARLDQPITQHEVARLIHMSPSSFGRFFKQLAGRTFIDYLNELRIGEACRLLTETDLSITQISLRVGYANLTYFDRRFRRAKGMTARQWRNASRPGSTLDT
jgi:AraC-like DNA-binding protein